MALDTKPNLNSEKFEQFTGDTLNLSGTTRIYGNIEYAGLAPTNPNPNSLASRSYVTGLTTTSGVQTANNGLTKTGSNVALGGSFDNVLLTGSANSNFVVTGTDNNVIQFSDGNNIINVGTNGYIAERGIEIFSLFPLVADTIAAIQFSGSSAKFGTFLFDLSNTSQINLEAKTDNFNNTSLLINDNRATKRGIQYAGNYSSGFNSRSLVDAGYVTGSTMLLAGVQTNTGLKTFLDGTFGMRNVANTFTSQFTNTNTSARTYTLPNSSGTVLLGGITNTILSGTAIRSTQGGTVELISDGSDFAVNQDYRLQASASGLLAAYKDDLNFSSIVPGFQVIRTSYTPTSVANGFGVSVNFGIHNPSGTVTQGQIGFRFTDAASNPRKTEYTFSTTDADGVVIRSLMNRYGFRYAADYSANFVNRSLVDVGYVTGRTSQIVGKNVSTLVSNPTGSQDGFSIVWDNANNRYTLTNVSGGSGGVSVGTFNTYTGTTAPNQFANRTIFNSYTGTTNTDINNRLLTSAFNTYSGVTQTNINNKQKIITSGTAAPSGGVDGDIYLQYV